MCCWGSTHTLHRDWERNNCLLGEAEELCKNVWTKVAQPKAAPSILTRYQVAFKQVSCGRQFHLGTSLVDCWQM